LRRIFASQFRQLPVVGDGKVLGVVSRRDLYLEEQDLLGL
jgi:CBS domain-containing protein